MIRCAAVGSQEEWVEVAAEVRRTPDPLESPALKRLYDLARRDGAAAIRTFHQLSEEDRQDLVIDAFLKTVREIVHAADPLKFFITVARNAGRDRLRERATHRRKHEEIAGAVEARQVAGDVEGTQVRAIDMHRALSRLSLRDHDIVVAVFGGEERDDIARRCHLTRGAVDQIVSRFQRRLREEQP